LSIDFFMCPVQQDAGAAVYTGAAPVVPAVTVKGDRWIGPAAKVGLKKRKWQLVKQFLEAEVSE
jgi:hypothetical protein